MKSSKKGSTLVELVIVVLILGILAAVAVPRLFNTSTAAIDNGLKQTLSTVRDAIELYTADHAKLPGETNTLDVDLQDYIRGPFPKCPVGEPTSPDGILVSTADAPISGALAPVEGWHYNSTTGEFIVNYSGVSATDSSVTYDQF